MSVEELTESAIAMSEVLTEAHMNTRASQERVRRQTKQKKALNKQTFLAPILSLYWKGKVQTWKVEFIFPRI